MLRTLLTCLALSLLLTTGHAKTQIDKKFGTLKEGMYFSKKPPFSIKIPDLYFSSAIIQHVCVNENVTEVSAQDDLGKLFRFNVTNLNAVQKPIPKDHLAQLYSGIFKDVLLPSIQTVIPQAHVLNEENTLVDGKEAFFALVDLPNGSNLVDSVTGERTNSMRGFLIILHDNQLVTLSFQNDMLFSKFINDFVQWTSDQVKENYEKILIESANSFKVIAQKEKTRNKEKMRK